MPWVTPTLEQLRTIVRSNLQAQLRSGPLIPNSVERVIADTNAGVGYLVLLYINWLALQLMPDTAEEAFLDRFGTIWKPGGQGRKTGTYATAVIQFTSIGSITMPASSILTGANDVSTGLPINFATATATVIGTTPTNVTINALSVGHTGLVVGSQLSLQTGIAGINGAGTISSITDGIEQETDDELRARVLDRIQQPPVGGDAEDFVQWAKATPGVNVTRAWCSPLEMGPGTITIRFMTDDLVNNIVGFPSAASISAVQAYIDTVRPVAIKDRFVFGPTPQPINFTISNLVPNTTAIRNAIAVSVAEMLYQNAAPAHAINGIEQPATTIYAEWVSGAITAAGATSFTLTMVDQVMPNQSCLAVLGTIVYA